MMVFFPEHHFLFQSGQVRIMSMWTDVMVLLN